MAVTTNELDIDIKAKSEQATSSLDSLISKLKEVNTALNSLNTHKITDVVGNMKGLKSVKVNTGGSGVNNGSMNQYSRANSLMQTLTKTTDNANKGFLNLNNTIFKLAATWGMFYASAYPFIRAMNAAWQSSQSAMDYVETYNYYSVTMKKIMAEVGEDAADAFTEKYVDSLSSLTEKMTGFTVGLNGELFESFSKNLGADPEAMMNYQARIGAVTNSVGLLGETSVDTQKALSMLSQDLSSLTNTDLSVVMENMQSGLIGMARSLYKYGIDITQASLKTIAYEHGITQSVSSMTQAQKMELRLLAILDQSKVAWGDMANTVNSVANQYRMLSQNVGNLSRVMGNLFLPIITKVLPYVNALTIALRQMFSILGFKLFGDNWLKNTLQGISSGNAVTELSDEVDDVTDSIDGATKSAKKFKQATMGWDELNIINPNTSSGGGSGSGGGGDWDLTADIENALAEYEDVWNKAFADAENKAVTLANRLMSYIKRGNFEGLGKWFSDSLANQLNSINWDKVYSGAKSFGKGLANFLNGVVQPNTFASVGKTVANSLNTAIYTAMSFGETFDFTKLGDSIASYWNAVFTNFDFGALGRTVGLWVGGVSKTIATAIKNIKWDNLFDGFKKSLNGFFEGLKDSKVTIGDLSIVVGLLAIKKIAKLHWGATVLKAISQQLAKGLASRIGVDIAADATFSTALAQGLASQFAKVPSKLGNVWTLIVGSGGYFNLNTAMTKQFGAMATNLVGIGNVIGGITLTLHEFFDMWKNGWDGVSEILKDVGIGLTAFGAVVLGVSAPVATLVAALTALGSTALILAHEQLPQIGDTIKEVLSSPGGISISDLCKNTSENIAKIGDGFIEVSNKSDALEGAKNNAKDVAENIQLIALHMKEGTISVEEGTSQIVDAFSQLKDAADTYVLGTEQVLLSAFGEGGAFAQAYENMGYDIGQTTSVIVQNTSDAQKELAALQDEINSGEVEVGSERFAEIINRMYELSGNTDEATKALRDYKTEMDGVTIDLSTLIGADGEIDISGLKSSLSQIHDSTDLTFKNVEKGSDEMKDALNEAISQASDPEKIEYFRTILQGLPDAVDYTNSEVSREATELTDAVQTQLIGKLTDEFNQAMTDWDEMNWWEKLMSGADNKDEYAKQRVDEFKKGYIDPVSTEIETQFDDLGIEGAGWSSEASQQIIDAMFDEKVIHSDMGADLKISLSDNWKTVLDNTANGSYTVAYKNGKYIVKGIGEGAKEQTKVTTKEASDNLFSSLWKNICDKFGIHSPAENMKPLGSFMLLGAIEGFTDKFTEWTKTIDDWFENYVKPYFKVESWTFDGIKEGLMKSFTAALNGVKSLWNSFADWINENLKWTIDPVVIRGKKLFDGAEISLAHLPKFNIPAYAIGGFPEDGLFMANHNELVGQFSNGQTAVANNMQIVDGIKSGVAQAVREEIGNYLREIADNTSDTATNTHEIARKPVSGGMSDRDVAKANLRGQRSLGMQLRLT